MDTEIPRKITKEQVAALEENEAKLQAHIDELKSKQGTSGYTGNSTEGWGDLLDKDPMGQLPGLDEAKKWKEDYFPLSPEAKKLLIEVEAFEIQDSKDWLLGVKAGIKITRREMTMLKKGEINKVLIKKLEKLRKLIDQRLRNKQTLIDLLK